MDKSRGADSAQTWEDRVCKLTDVPEPVCDLVQWLDGHRTGQVVIKDAKRAARRFRRVAHPKAAHKECEARGAVQQLHRVLRERVACVMMQI